MTFQGHLHQFIDLLWPSHGRLVTWCFLGGSEVKASACNAGDLGSIPGSGRSPGEGNANPLQYSCLENPMDRGAWQATIHGVEVRGKLGPSQARALWEGEPVTEAAEPVPGAAEGISRGTYFLPA